MPTTPGPQPAESMQQTPQAGSPWNRLTGWLRPDHAPCADDALGYESAQPHMAAGDPGGDAGPPPR